MGFIKVNGRKITNPFARVLIPTTALLVLAFVAAVVICGLLIVICGLLLATGLVFAVLILAAGLMLLYAAVRAVVTARHYFANWNENRRR